MGGSDNRLQVLSLPTRERGLKLKSNRLEVTKWIVAPYAGAWIEIGIAEPEFKISEVAPYAGAWIEIILGTS